MAGCKPRISPGTSLVLDRLEVLPCLYPESLIYLASPPQEGPAEIHHCSCDFLEGHLLLQFLWWSQHIYQMNSSYRQLLQSYKHIEAATKLAAISQSTVSNAFSYMKNVVIWVKFQCVPKDLIDNKSALVEIMDWHRTSDGPLFEQMLAYFADIYMYI